MMPTGFSDPTGDTEIPMVAGLPSLRAAGSGETASPGHVSLPDFPAKHSVAPGRPGSGALVLSSNPAFTPAGAGDRVTQAEVDALETGLGQALSALENSLVEEVLTETLPLTGDRFSAAFDNNVAGFRYLNTLRTAVVGGLATLTAGPDYSPSQVASPVNSRLTSAGFASGSAVTVTTVNDQVQLAFVTSDTFSAAAVPLGSDFGLPNLDLDLLSPKDASTVIAVVLNFTAGVDGTGFYVETDAPNTLFTLNTTTTLSATLNAPVRFARLPFRLNDRSTSPRTNVTANFILSLHDPDNNGKIRSSEFTGLPDLLDATVTGTAALNMAITSDLPTAAAMPKVRTDFTLTWSYSVPQTVDPDDNNQSFGSAPLFSLKNNSIHLNTFFNAFADNVLNHIGDVTEPLDPLIDILTAEIPLLSDLDSEAVTILDVAGAGEAEVAAIDGLQALNALDGTAADTVWANMGSFTYNGDPRTALLSELTPALTSVPSARPAELADFLEEAHAVEGLAFPLLENTSQNPDGRVLADLLMGRPADLFTYKSGTIELSDEFHAFYPVLGPIGVTLGGRAGVRTQFGFGFDTQGIFDYYDAGPGATADMIFHGFYAIAADENGDPFTGISLYAGVTAGVEANIGFASVGVEGDITAEIGFWLDENAGDEFGRIRGDMFAALPIDDLFYASGSLSAGLRAYVEVGIGPFSVGYDWESPRVTLISFDDLDDEVPILAEPDPGDLTKLILNVGDRAPRRIFGPIDDRAEEFTIRNGLDGIVIGAFNEENGFPAPSLITGDSNERGDVMELDPDVAVPALLHGGDGRDIFRGGAMADELYGDAGPDKLEGRGGDDTLRGGDGNDELMGGSGADTMDGGAGEDTASWLDSPSPITINLQTNERTGESSLDTLISIERYKGSGFDDTLDGSALNEALLNGGPGNDIVRGHAGNDQLEGGSDNDTVEGGPGNDLINGGPGADILDGGDGMDILSYLSPSPPGPPPGVVLEPVTVNLKTGLGTRGEAAGDVVSGFEILYGSGVPAGVSNPQFSGDDLTGGDNGETIHGMGGTDLIHGGGGNDLLYGDNADATDESFMTGFDADTIYGDAGNDQIFGQTDDDELYGGDGNDMLDGGIGEDDLDGNAGQDTLLGGAGDDHLHTVDLASPDLLDGQEGYNRLSADYSDHPQPFNFTAGISNTFAFPDGDRFTRMQTLGTLVTGSGNDIIRLTNFREPVYFQKTISTGEGDDLVIADSRELYPFQIPRPTSDNINGGGGRDTVSFEQSVTGVSVNLKTGVMGGGAAGMTLTGVEDLIGSHFVDTLDGDDGPNTFDFLTSGRTGLFPAPSLHDRANGGNGEDTLRADFSKDPLANQFGVDLSVTVVHIKDWQTFPVSTAYVVAYLSSIERFEVTGTDRDDILSPVVPGAPVAADIFRGGKGNDEIRSNQGDDFVDGGEGNDYIEDNSGNDTLLGGPGDDVILAEDVLGNGYGADFIDGGPGDDFVSDVGPHVAPIGLAGAAGTYLRLEGGDGVDTVSADFSDQTEAIRFSEDHPIDHTFADGSYFRDFELLGDFYSGEGADEIILSRRFSNYIRMQGGDDILNPGLGASDNVDGGPGDDWLILDYSKGEGAGVGPVVIENGRMFRRNPNTSQIVDGIVAANFEHFYVIGSSLPDEITGSAGGDYLYGGLGNDTLLGRDGDDVLDGGPGVDQFDGGAGYNTFIVDDPGDTNVGANKLGVALCSVDVPVNNLAQNLVLTGPAVVANGGAQSNKITGNTRDNILNGEGGNDTLNGGGGPSEKDRLNGGTGSDIFVLGDGLVRFYDDGNPTNPGLDGYAVIEDFTPTVSEKLRLTGSAAQYFLGISPIAGFAGTALYHDSNASGVLEAATDELIAIIISPVALTAANTLTPGTYPAPVTPDSIGLTAPPVVTAISGANGVRLQLQFTISEPMPAGALLEIQASTDLGINDPWQTIVSKFGSAAWTGLVPIVVGTPNGGQVTVTFTDIPASSGSPTRFLRLRVGAP